MPTNPNKKPIDLYNPTTNDFSFYVAEEETNIKREYIIPAGEIVEFPKWIADKGAKELAVKIVWKRGLDQGYEHELKKVLEEIYV